MASSYALFRKQYNQPKFYFTEKKISCHNQLPSRHDPTSQPPSTAKEHKLEVPCEIKQKKKKIQSLAQPKSSLQSRFQVDRNISVYFFLNDTYHLVPSLFRIQDPRVDRTGASPSSQDNRKKSPIHLFLIFYKMYTVYCNSYMTFSEPYINNK